MLEYYELSSLRKSVRSEHLNRTTSSEHPADLGHINSVDRNSEGDYLVSIKYFSQVVKIAGRFRVNSSILVHRPSTKLTFFNRRTYQVAPSCGVLVGDGQPLT